MTSKRRNYAECHECGGVAICENCGAKVPASTQFSEWLRKQLELDSKIGFITTNIDYLWKNYNTDNWMLIEEKRHMRSPSKVQRKLFAFISKLLKAVNSKYHGFHTLIFENTSPDDGKIYLNGETITKNELIEFLQFSRKPKYRGL